MTNAKDDLQTRWWQLESRFMEKFEKKPDVESVLMLIGVQEIRNSKQHFNKEEKQDLMHVAVCSVLAQSGYYEVEGYDKQGWPRFRQLKALPEYNIVEQENFLKDHILLYFDNLEDS